MKRYTIYKITNIINNKIYIGQTIHSFQRRFKQHIKESLKRPKTALHRAIRKYKDKSFKIEEIFITFNYADSCYFEQFFIDEYKSIGKLGYNLARVKVGVVPSPYISSSMKKDWKNNKAARLLALKKGIHSLVNIENSTKRLVEYNKTQMAREEKSISSKNMWNNSKYKKYMQKIMKEKHKDPVYKENIRQKLLNCQTKPRTAIVAVNIYNQNIIRFKSIYEAETNKYYRPNIKDCLNNKTKTAFAHCWFKDDGQENSYFIEQTLIKIGKFKDQFNKPIIRTDMKTFEIVEYNNIFDIKKDGFKIKEVNQVLYGRYAQHKGYFWTYK